MHFIQALYLWAFISALAVGCALVFRRFFPEESPWFGFLVPPLALVLALNFVEHFVALPDLLPLLPLLIFLIGWLARDARYSRRELLLPTFIFLGSFAFTFGIRCLQPDILPTSDGLSDLNKINNYCQGQTLPPIDTWMPPYHYVWYYSLQHYAASIVKRLLHVDLGVAYNISHALLSALTCVAGAAAAHRLSGGRAWITVAVPFLIESAATGSMAYLRLSNPNYSFWLANNLSGGVIDYDAAKAAGHPDTNPLWSWLAQNPYRERLELQVPGFWTWRDEYHANMAGHFLTLLSVFVMAELILRVRTLWPWVMAATIPLIAVVSSTWAYPICILLNLGMAIIALGCGCRPLSWARLGIILGVSLVVLWPIFYDVTSSPQVPDILWTKTEWRAFWREFLVQWWPIILLWITACFYIRTLSPVVRWILVVVPLMLIGVELITVEGRYNTVEKMWGYTFGAGLIALFPVVAAKSGLHELYEAGHVEGLSGMIPILTRRAGLGPRLVVIILLLSATISLSSWIYNTLRWAPWDGGIFHLEGDHYLTIDEQKKEMLRVMKGVRHRTFLSGKCIWCYNESPALAVFSENRSFIAWSYFESVADYPDVATYREKLNNDFYAGTMTHPLTFLTTHDIAGIVIWPDDDISDAILAKIDVEINSTYEYIDLKGTGNNNAGIFLRRGNRG